MQKEYPKEDGRQRPISIPSLEDKIVQKAAAGLLNAIWEQDFLDCSHGFRPDGCFALFLDVAATPPGQEGSFCWPAR